MEKKPIITTPAILTRISYTKDGGLSLGFITQELTPEEKLAWSLWYQDFGWLAWRSNEVKIEDIPEGDAEDKDKKPSKRLRNVLYVLAQQEGVPKKKFEAYYREKMDKIIEWVKGKLEPRL